MQQILDFTADDTKYVSKPFDFEALCMINDAHISDPVRGPLSVCRGAVDYMFEGTNATQDVIDSLDPIERARLCMKLWGFYTQMLSSKN